MPNRADRQCVVGILPKPIVINSDPDSEEIQVEPAGDNSYEVTMLAPDTVAEYLKWSEQLEPDFALMRKALERPYTRVPGNYSDPLETPAPNWVGFDHISRWLATMAPCHLVQGKPEEALRDLTLMRDLCRILEGSRPVTLPAAMRNSVVNGLYAETIGEGLRWRAWREPQLAALEEQLRQINLLSPLKQAIETDRASFYYILERPTPHYGVDIGFCISPLCILGATGWTSPLSH